MIVGIKKDDKYFIWIILFSIFHFVSIDAQTVQWAQKGISPGYEYGNGIVTDDSGNAYVAGQIEYTTQFNGISLTTYGIHDIMAGKFGPDGSIKWLHHAGGPGGDHAWGVGVDDVHNSYVIAEFELTASFGSGISYTSSGSNDVVLIKYDINGNTTWAKKFGSSGNDKGKAIAVSPSGDCYITGYFSGTTAFGSYTLNTTGISDVFVAKLNSSGNVLWAKSGGGSDEDRGYGIAYDKNGNVFVAGKYFNSATFGSTTISNTDTTSGFLAKYNSNGNFQWVKTAGSCCSATEFNCVTVDENGFIYAAGYFVGTGDYGSYHFTSAGSADIVIVKYDQSGNVVWAKQAGGPTEDIANGISIDTISHIIYVTGQIDGHGYFDTHYVGTAGNRDVFIAAYDMNGNCIWAKPYGGNQRDIGYAIANDKSGNIFTTGVFTTNANFGSYNLTGDSLYDFYIDKVSPQPAPQPSNQSSALSLTPVNCTDLQLSFTPGNGDRRIVVVHAVTTVNSFPVDGNIYNADSVFGNGSNLGNGNYVVYDGTGNTVTVSGLTQGIEYYFAVFEYNGQGAFSNYLTTSPSIISAVSGTISVSINAATNSICAGDSVILQANGASLYNWSPVSSLSSSSGTSVVATPINSTIYTVNGTDSNGCHARSQVMITVNPNPVVTFSLNDSLCVNSSPLILTGGLPANGNYSGTGVIAGTFDPSISGAGNFVIQYNYTDSNGCSGNNHSTLKVHTLPVVTTTTISPMCENGFQMILNNGHPSGGVYNGTGVVTGIFNPAIGAGSYPVIYSYTDNHGCSDSSLFNLTVEPLPVVNLGSDTTICAGNNILIDAGSGSALYNWSTGNTTESILVDSNGTGIGSQILSVEVSSLAGCRNSDTIVVSFSICTGIENLFSINSGVRIFPNPFSNSFTIETDRKISIFIYDDLGKLIEKNDQVNGIFTTGNDLVPGIYFIEIISEDFRKTISVVKSR